MRRRDSGSAQQVVHYKERSWWGRGCCSSESGSEEGPQKLAAAGTQGFTAKSSQVSSPLISVYFKLGNNIQWVINRGL